MIKLHANNMEETKKLKLETFLLFSEYNVRLVKI